MHKPNNHKVLSSSRSVITTARINSDTQKNNQVQNVQVVVHPSTVKEQDHEAVIQPPTYPNVYSDLPLQPVTIERSVDDVLDPIQAEIQDKDNLIKALSLILDIMRSNPLIINKYIIPSSNNLQELILLLTNSDSVQLQFDDPEVSCFCTPDEYLHVKSIYVTKGTSQYIFKHAFPQAVRILDDNKISSKIVIFDPEPDEKIITYN